MKKLTSEKFSRFLPPRILAWTAKSPINKAIALGGVCVAVIAIVLLLFTAFSEDKRTSIETVVPPETAYVQVTKDGFVPATLNVKAGTQVVWTSTDEALHRIAANPHPTRDSLPGLYSEILNQGQTYMYSFNDVGTFQYHDEYNPMINATIEVTH